MKQYTHAWITLKAIEYLASLDNKLQGEHNSHLKRFIKFIFQNPSTFLRGTWFPDTVIADNLSGGHTWKYYPDENGRKESRKPPVYMNGRTLIKKSQLLKVSLETKYSDLPDRCEALSQSIRDMILITNKIDSGDVIIFNNSQIALFFSMLSHYIADAHMPLHCDIRDFYGPSKIHGDIEAYWEHEILNIYKVSKKSQYFDLDEDFKLQKQNNGESKLFDKIDDLIENTNINVRIKNEWRDYLCHNNIWDLLVSICYISFHQSMAMLPMDIMDNDAYKTIDIMADTTYSKKVIKFSPYILSDAIKAVAFIWLSTWERWELLLKGIV